MFRLFAMFANLLVAVILNIIFVDDIGVTMDAPAEVVAGTEFTVRVTIKKGELESFSRLLQSMPAGLSAQSTETSNADFSFESKRARFIWLRMPDEEEFEVSYKVKVDQRLKGSFNIAGKFSYISDNERRTVTTESNQIVILPSPDIDESLIVDIKDYERLVIPYIPTGDGQPQIACIRQKPELSEDGDGYIVKLLVSKERKEKFAKIEEIIPKGYKAVPIEDGDAIFTFKKNTAKFLWMNLPASSFFLVSYKLVPSGIVQKPDPAINGQFSYLEEAKTVSIDIKQTGEELADVRTPEELNTLLMNISTGMLATAEPKDVTKDVKVKTKRKEPRSTRKYKLEPEEGIYYRVQLAAGHSLVNIRRYFRKYKLEMQVRHEMHEGWYKYSVGSFPEYKQARDYRVHIWNTTIIDDAFVSAYNNGARITVQEALMISNQKWYR